MPRKGVPGIITVGNRREWPRETWGWKDWQDEEASEIARNPELNPTVAAPPPGPQIASGFSLFPKPRGR
jgi:hypothetical protein